MWREEQAKNGKEKKVDSFAVLVNLYYAALSCIICGHFTKAFIVKITNIFTYSKVYVNPTIEEYENNVKLSLWKNQNNKNALQKDSLHWHIFLHRSNQSSIIIAIRLAWDNTSRLQRSSTLFHVCWVYIKEESVISVLLEVTCKPEIKGKNDDCAADTSGKQVNSEASI